MVDTVAFIPAKGSSQRIPAKNTRYLGKHPLLAYTIETALRSGSFTDVYVVTDDVETHKIAAHYGAKDIVEPGVYTTEPDIVWVQHALKNIARHGFKPEAYSIVRCTSPFKTAKDIREAKKLWDIAYKEGYSSLRAVEKPSQHPAKMWRRQITGEITPVLLQPDGQKWHDSPYQTLPEVYIQNASIEMARADLGDSISGTRIYGYLSTGYSGFDLNFQEDWDIAEAKIDRKEFKLPKIVTPPWQT
jgi:CMP-N,N'-diacetyllegionaminic acid synthase